MNNIIFVLFACNEEKRIAYAIKNFISYGEVIVFDGGSTDRTKEISEELGATFLPRPKSDKPQVETQENFAFLKERIKTDWIYWGYVDNIAPKTLIKKFIEIAKEDRYKMVVVPLYTYLWGNIKKYAQKSYTPFFFHKDFIDFSDNHIHGMGKFLGAKKQLLKLSNKSEYALRHFSTYNINKFVIGHLRYAIIEAEGKYLKGEKFSTVRMLAGMIRYWWIYRRSLRYGSLGLIILFSYSFFRMIAYAKLYEFEQGIDINSIENAYSLEKEKLLKDF